MLQDVSYYIIVLLNMANDFKVISRPNIYFKTKFNNKMDLK